MISADLTAERFVEQLEAFSSPEQLKKYQRYFTSGNGDSGKRDVFIGVRMGDVFGRAKAVTEMSPAEIEKLLESPSHEVRAGGLSIMDKQARRTKTPEHRRRELFDLYLRRTDRIDNWDLVDLGAPNVVGGYLFDKPRDVLYELARSESMGTPDGHGQHLVLRSPGGRGRHVGHRGGPAGRPPRPDPQAVGGLLREAGKKDRERLMRFLDRHAATMPRTLLRYAIKHLESRQRDPYRALKA